MNNKLQQLEDEIYSLRMQLYNLITNGGLLQDEEVLILSTRLDVLLNDYWINISSVEDGNESE